VIAFRRGRGKLPGVRILFDHHSPFNLAHGGFQTQIEGTRDGLRNLGVEVEEMRWWDERQTGSLIHFFGAAPIGYLNHTRAKSIPVVSTNLFTATCNRSDVQLWLQGCITRAGLALPFGEGLKNQLSWRSFQYSSCNVVGLDAERQVLKVVYGVPDERIAIVPLGLADAFLNPVQPSRCDRHLICAGTITERKNSVPLARLALEARVPILFVGKPYSEDDPYWHAFARLIDGESVLHSPHVSNPEEMAHLLRCGRGAVVMSQYENWCLAAHEAAACGLPLLLPRLKWAAECFGEKAHYFSGDFARDVQILKRFYEHCPRLSSPGTPSGTWRDTAQRLITVYERVLSTSE
jgi:glycosyltransferase involved in cell wall biosynthesis